MRQLSPAGQEQIADIAQRHGFGVDAVRSMLDAVVAGNGSMAQFNHPEFAGSGQWMRGGMTMVSDMFDSRLKGRVDALCADLAELVAGQPELVRAGSFQSQRQGGAGGDEQTQSHHGQEERGAGRPGDVRSPAAVSLFVPPAAGRSADWWPHDLRWPDSTGAQNGVRYACFSQARRLAIEAGGRVTVYDMLDHRIGGFSQQQHAKGGSLSFHSQYGLIDVESLPVESTSWSAAGVEPSVHAHTQQPASGWSAAPAQTHAAPPSQPASEWAIASPSPSSGDQQAAASGNPHDIFATIEKLAALHAKGILSDDEFGNKKSELLGRL